jgi:hypothetical protein
METSQALSNRILEKAYEGTGETPAFPWMMIIEIILSLIGNCDPPDAAERAVNPTIRDRIRFSWQLRKEGIRWRDRGRISDAAFEVAADAGEAEVAKAMQEIISLD